MFTLVFIIIAFICGMALGGLVVGMDKDSERKEGTYDTSDGLHQDK